ncbi:unnamed protein product [Didymodactylos carnosus]|uniref:Uncharacterized protein n=1 Tax=Didymodactylos carnosus TaxID=1234261 RepID=A0A814QFR4_9BILA|nr:unnamed protein product [Didymodactylos carnosus]CAF1265032.1 unnamed protein product [Didymodactylos carnosus]CAF3883402.1 unnamed protein product [Didymodactylos carnosus]CAF4071309.1 unnamed protein product [Didymodactylos carnosus]
MSPSAKLQIIRRGSSMTAIDLNAAGEFRICLYKTPGVNALFAAQYIYESLNLPIGAKQGQICVAVIGSGSIGSRGVQKLIQEKHKVVVYSPALAVADDNTRGIIARKKGIRNEQNVSFANSPEQAVRQEHVLYVVIAIDA